MASACMPRTTESNISASVQQAIKCLAQRLVLAVSGIGCNSRAS